MVLIFHPNMCKTRTHTYKTICIKSHEYESSAQRCLFYYKSCWKKLINCGAFAWVLNDEFRNNRREFVWSVPNWATYASIYFVHCIQLSHYQMRSEYRICVTMISLTSLMNMKTIFFFQRTSVGVKMRECAYWALIDYRKTQSMQLKKHNPENSLQSYPSI